METVPQDEVASRFAEMMAPYIRDPNVNPHALIELVATFYRGVRIDGAVLEEDGVMLLLQWGEKKAFLAEEFIDFRTLTDDDIGAMPQQRYRYINLTRQIFSPEQSDGDTEDDEFDDIAIGLSVDLLFDPVGEDKESGNMWIENPSVLPQKLEDFLSILFVKELLDSYPSCIGASVSFVG